MPNPATVPDTVSPPNAQPRNGRPPGRSSYYLRLERMAAKRSNLRDGALADPFLRASEVGVLLDLGYSAVYRLIRSRQLKASRTTAQRGHFRIRLSAVQQFIQEHTQ